MSNSCNQLFKYVFDIVSQVLFFVQMFFTFISVFVIENCSPFHLFLKSNALGFEDVKRIWIGQFTVKIAVKTF